ncbi:MAG TPA: RNA polymerase sigma factor [Vitreimonas sp.]|uniref:RNA polymerase sigma factor n=1 Tax=Vitreimonas sp. TaxID=3069702 RepID=UPI002D3434BC|nr:RNA polymerase sigma factor [Vitreimonas sp.]HYD86568.1 RNA polymerase sigma factor [Vitreimonas sp.]
MDAGEEARLIGLARNGDMRAFGHLVDAHQPAVRAFLRRLVGNYADADDLAQDAFARTWEVLERYDGSSSLRTFICGVAFQYWRRARRSQSRRQAREDAYAELADTESEPPARAAARLALRKAMDDLPGDQRAALALCLGQDFTHAEAAEVLKLPLGTVKSHVTRGRARLQAALGVTEKAS